MELEPIRLVKFDIHGTDPLNTFEGEVHKLKDKTCPWIIPNGSPFFADPSMVVLYDQRGAEMKLDRDYFIQGEFTPFCAVTGQSICSFIELSPDILRDNEEVKIDYQSIGAWFVPRSNLQEWLDAIRKGVTPIDWSKVFGVPPTLPPEYHLHNAQTEIADWYELTWFFAYLEKVLSLRDPEANDKITTIVEEVYGALVQTRKQRLAQIVAHDENYHQPHGTNKFDILLGNHDNFPTATFPEELAGLRNDVLSTPRGVAELAKTYRVDTSAAMLQGIIPLSRFGGESFIPPNISGSFEGMGQEVETSGICLEPSGLVMLLSNHMDGRTRGLYFSIVENYNKDNIKITYTNFKYRPPVLQSQGIEVDRIVAGSGNKVIMTGKYGTNDWFIALTNDTFDPGAHSYVRCDMSAILSIAGNPYIGNDTAMVHHMGDYLVLVQLYAISGRPTHRFFRVKTEDVRLGKPVVWELLKVSYQDWGGTQHNNMDGIEVMDYDRDASGFYTRYGPWTPAQPINSVSIVRRALTLVAPKGNIRNTFHIHFLHYHFLTRSESGRSVTIGGMSDMYYEFNSETGVFTLISKPSPLNLPLDPQIVIGVAGFPQLADNVVSFISPSSVVLQTGEIASTHVVEGAGDFPVRFKLTKMVGGNTPETLLNKSLSLPFSVAERAKMTAPIVEPATLNGTFPANLSYDTDGELFEAIDSRVLENNRYKRQMYTRVVAGDYQQREGINNLIVGNVKSRPLTTAIYKANLRRTDSVTSITGSAAELAAAGVECGALSLSTCGYTSCYADVTQGVIPRTPELKAPAGNNVLLTFPRTHSKSIDPVNKTSTYKGDTFYGIRQNIVDKLKTVVPASANSPYWCFTLTHLGQEVGGTFRGLNVSVAMVNWLNQAAGTYRGRLLLIQPVVEAPNASHPGVYLITDFNVLDAPPEYPAFQDVFYQPTYPQFNHHTEYLVKGGFNAYRDGNTLKVYHTGGYIGDTSNAGEIPFRVIFDLDIAANKLLNVSSGNAVGSQFSDVVAMIPKVGMSDVTLVAGVEGNVVFGPKTPYPHQYTGGGAAIFKKDAEYYLTMSVYPETGWVLFLQEGIRMLVNGTPYTMAGGTIDLRDVDSAPQNKTFYVYATVEDDKPKYIITTNQLRKAGNMMKAATIVTNDKQILTITRHQPLMIGGYMLSYTREGGIIPMSTGFPQDEGDFIFLHQAELLP